MKLRIRGAYTEYYGRAAIQTKEGVLCRPDLAGVPTNEREVEQQRNAMAFGDGRYPVGMSDCYVIGISGGCGLTCPVFMARKCEHQEEMEADAGQSEQPE